MIRLIIKDVTLTKGPEGVTAQIRFRGGATRTLMVPHPPPAWEQQQTSPEVIELIDQLLDDHTNVETANILNEGGLRSGAGKSFHGKRIASLVSRYALPSRFERLRRSAQLLPPDVVPASPRRRPAGRVVPRQPQRPLPLRSTTRTRTPGEAV